MSDWNAKTCDYCGNPYHRTAECPSQPVPATPPEQPAPEGDKWELGPPVHHGGIQQREVRRKGQDSFNGGHVCTAAARDAEGIVTDHRLAALVSGLVTVLKEAMKVCADRAAGGRMLTTTAAASEIYGKCAKAILDVNDAARKAGIE